MAEVATYTIELRKDGKPISSRKLRIWPDELLATEAKGQLIGHELARDAIHDAGLWEDFDRQRGKTA